ncbi:Conserved hypothetical protein [Prochlorococcus marinus str. MIT 9303]|uniref:Uncharacterized protein n=1 Tax=Prochlorococcus marinus (strain MIT 9303) TaxID=59922 RepID=A2CCY3_PROM3|nr:Conserved hypothetical protein [Prochlorococcus marinus str. MIT 9303]
MLSNKSTEICDAPKRSVPVFFPFKGFANCLFLSNTACGYRQNGRTN